MGRGKIAGSLTLLALAAPVALTGCALTSTYGTGEAPEMALFREMTGGLMSKEKKEPIEYQPRAPLVMPASADLPQPVETAAAADAEWPIDPDERVIASVDDDDNPDNDITQADYRRLRPLAGAFGNSAAARTAAPNNDLDADRDEFYRFVHTATGQRDAFAKAVAESKGYARTERRYLTDPPLAYREAAETAPVGEVDTGVKKKGFWRRIMPGR
jgi:hypothetical protein